MRRLITIPGVLALVAGCGLLDSLTGTDQRRTLQRERDAWRALNIRDYGFDFQRACFCGEEQTQPVHVEVRGATIVSIVNITTGAVVVPTDFPRWPTVDSLFVWAERGMDYGYTLEITYDASYHFPGRVAGDLVRAIDDEYTETVANFARVVP